MAVAFGYELDTRDIRYALTGSVAASFYGEPRSTVDIDFTVMASREPLERLYELEGDFYVPRSAVAEAAEQYDSFNLIHHRTGLKIDIFVLDDSPFNQLMMDRRVQMVLPSGAVWTASPEDVTARKIRWYALANETSERQYRDIIALLSYGNVNAKTVIETATLVGLEELALRLVHDAEENL